LAIDNFTGVKAVGGEAKQLNSSVVLLLTWQEGLLQKVESYIFGD